MNLADVLDRTEFVGLAVWKTPTGYASSVEMQDGAWSPDGFGATASAAVAAVLPVLPCPVALPACPVPLT